MDKMLARRDRRAKHKAGSGIRALLALPILAAGSWITYSNLAIDHHLELPKAIDADRETCFSKMAGELSFYADRSASGRPIVFIHSINAAASAYEFRPLFEHYRGRRPLYVLDLPGFGFSERSDRVYTPELYRNAIIDFISSRVGGPSDVVALSLGCEFAASAALVQPHLFQTLTMISPSGFKRTDDVANGQPKAQDGDLSNILYQLLAFPLWGRAVFDLIATRPSIRWFLQQCFVGEVDADLDEYDYLTSHQPGAHYAPLYFISGKLFTRDIRRRVYEQLKLPILVIYDRDPFTTFDMLPDVLQRCNNWRAAHITPTLGLPQFERLLDTVRALDIFWQT